MPSKEFPLRIGGRSIVMEWYTGGALIGISILALLAMRMPLGFVFGSIGAGGLVIMTGNTNMLMSVVQNLHDMLSDFVLITIPLFVLMAELLSSAGFIPDLYESVEKFTGRIRGSIAIATIIASAIFAAVCGSSYVTAATLAKMTIPEMLDRGYRKSLTTGSVAAGGTLRILIPPQSGHGNLWLHERGIDRQAVHCGYHPWHSFVDSFYSVHRNLGQGGSESGRGGQSFQLG